MPKAKKTPLEKFADKLQAGLEADNHPDDLHVTIGDLRNLKREIINAARESNDV